MSSLPGPGEQQPAQLLFDLTIPQSRSPLLGHDDQVNGWQSGFVAAKKFPEQAFDAIALHRFPQAFGHHQSQTGTARLHGSQNQTKMARIEPLALGLGPEEVLAMAEPLCLGKTGGPSGVGFRTGTEHRQLISGMRLQGSHPSG
jgi:hypothetical protein